MLLGRDKAGGFARLIYGLEVPVRTAPDGKSSPLRYAASIKSALREKLGADPGYSDLVCKKSIACTLVCERMGIASL